jgi:hypothetical protein
MAPGPDVAMHTPDRSGELRIARGGERRHLLVAGLDELRLVLGAAEGSDKTVDAVAGIAEDLADVPLAQAGEDVVGDSGGHVCSLDRRDGISASGCGLPAARSPKRLASAPNDDAFGMFPGYLASRFDDG